MFTYKASQGHNIYMIRTLLVIDDYNEMIYLQTLLKKLGFDVDAVSTARKFADTLLGFNPKIIIMTAHGKKINGIELANSVVKRNGYPKIILVKTQGQVFASGELSEEKVDSVQESPVNFLNLIKVICDLESQLNFENLSNKLSNILSSDKADQEMDEKEYSPNSLSSDKQELIHIKGGNGPVENIKKPNTPVSWEKRLEGYNQFLKNMENPPQGSGGFVKERIKEYNKKYRVTDRDESMKELDESKKDFVRALYSHLKKSS